MFRISVIIPSYNVAPYLRACMRSVITAAKRLKKAEAEIICVDDGSTDGSDRIPGEFATDGGRVRIVTLKRSHQGVSSARNAALDAATGDWIAFVDADDTISERWFAIAEEMIAIEKDAEIVRLQPMVSVRDELSESTVDPWAINRSAAAAKAQMASVRNIQVRRGDEARRQALHCYSRYGWLMPNFIRRDFLGESRLPAQLRLKEDICLLLDLANRVRVFVTADFPGYFYTRRVGSSVLRARDDEDAKRFVEELTARSSGDVELKRAVSTAIGYDFIQWIEERDRRLAYDPAKCPIRNAWLRAQTAGGLDLGDLPCFWRPGIRLWLRFGWTFPAKLTRRLREWQKHLG